MRTPVSSVISLMVYCLVLYNFTAFRTASLSIGRRTPFRPLARAAASSSCVWSKKIKEIIDTKSSFADWLNNDNVRDQLKFDIKVCLVKNGYPPQYSPTVFSKVMEEVKRNATYTYLSLLWADRTVIEIVQKGCLTRITENPDGTLNVENIRLTQVA